MPILAILSVRHVFIIEIDDGSRRLVGLIEIGMSDISSCVSVVE